MYNLLSANFMRLKKEKVFWMLSGFMLVLGLIFPVVIKMDEIKTKTARDMDSIFGQYAIFIGIFMAVFCSFFVGKEYSDGTIRNKIIAGKRRADIYLANFIDCAMVSVMMCGCFFLAYLCVGIPLLGSFSIDLKTALQYLLTVISLSIAFSSIYNLIAMLSTNKAVTAVICILLAFMLLFIGMQLNQMLSQPETVTGMTDAEGVTTYEEYPNPDYLNGEERRIVQIVYDIIPGGQVAHCVSLDAVNLPMLPVYSLIIILLTTGIGLLCFKKKDIN